MYYTEKILFGAVMVLALANLTTPAAALCYAVMMGIFKEIFDWFHPMDFNPDLYDAVSISAGAISAYCFLKFVGAL